MDKNRKNGFTLAEVLITLVIIGVIAALTIPNLMQKYQEQTTVKKVQKFYSNLSNAYSLAMQDSGQAKDWGIVWDDESAVKIYELLFKPYFKISKDCGLDNKGNCIADSNNNLSFYKIVLDDGASVWWRGNEAGQWSYSIAINYDVNGLKGPNEMGKDHFMFIIRNDKAYPAGIQSGAYSMYPFNSYCPGNYGYGCAAWLIYKGNMDYLHCDLTWDKHSCKDK